MELWVHCCDNIVLKNLPSLLYDDGKKTAMWFLKNLPWEIYESLSPEYELQVQSALTISRTLKSSDPLKAVYGIYFGSDQCEFLIPTLDELKEAIKQVKVFSKTYNPSIFTEFALMTPTYGNLKMRERLISLFEYLNEKAQYINNKKKTVQIIVNDLGTIQLLKKYPNLVPVLWRTLVKTLKNPLVDTWWLDKNVHIKGDMMTNLSQADIDKAKKGIADNQRDFFDDTPLSNEMFINFYKKKNIDRFAVDYQTNMKNAFKTMDQNIGIDIYYPYSRVFQGRLCDIGAIDDSRRGNYPIDKVCPRSCLKYQMSIKNFQTIWYKLIQKGNSQYKTAEFLELPEETIKSKNNRLIYTPIM